MPVAPAWRAGKTALVVTAHPDDECMFFTPTLLELRAAGVSVSVLCLSTGNAAGLGAVRARELRQSCAVLGVADDRVRLVDNDALQDGMCTHWSPDAVAAEVDAAVVALRPEAIVTFDKWGVTRHPNHIAVHGGVVRWLARNPHAGVHVYLLRTVWLAERFLGLLGLMLAIVCNLHGLCGREAGHRMDGTPPAKVTVLARGIGALATCHRAMRAHRSQYVWFRRIYVAVSRYVFVNELARVPGG